MAKQALSVTLSEENVLWLKARAAARNGRGVSELVDGLVTEARRSAPADTVRSVAGTIDIADEDPSLESADDAVRTLFDHSLSRPFAVTERSPEYGARKRKRGG